jgi:hypothetical protein
MERRMRRGSTSFASACSRYGSSGRGPRPSSTASLPTSQGAGRIRSRSASAPSRSSWAGAVPARACAASGLRLLRLPRNLGVATEPREPFYNPAAFPNQPELRCDKRSCPRPRAGNRGQRRSARGAVSIRRDAPPHTTGPFGHQLADQIGCRSSLSRFIGRTGGGGPLLIRR